MSSDDTARSMSQRIFDLRLPIEAVSLYLLCCALADAGTPITRTALSDRWNDSSEALDREIAALEKRHILRAQQDRPSTPIRYQLQADRYWQ